MRKGLSTDTSIPATDDVVADTQTSETDDEDTQMGDYFNGPMPDALCSDDHSAHGTW